MCRHGAAVTLACVWEATAPKPGNVYPGADFPDMAYSDFVRSAVAIGPIFDLEIRSVGQTIVDAVQATQAEVRKNTNLGTILLIAPLAAVARDLPLKEGIHEVLERLSEVDTKWVFEAIRLANPGGLGRTDQADVRDDPPRRPLREIMALAADRDLVARQFANGFHEVLSLIAPKIVAEVAAGNTLSSAIVWAFLGQMAREPDSLIARKVGGAVAEEARQRAAEVVAIGRSDPARHRAAVAEFDGWLRADGNRRNPGTTADLIAAALFAILRDHSLPCSARW